MSEETRWKQRLRNFEASLNLLEMALDIAEPDLVQRAGLIQFYEMAFELSWKTLKDFLEAKGFLELRGPRDVLKLAFNEGLIDDGHLWMKALEDRNLTSHTYDENTAQQIEVLIRNYYANLLRLLKSKLLSLT